MKIKNMKKLLLLFIVFLFLILCHTTSFADTDVINDYTIKINTRNDGTLDMYYHIEWEVLDDSTVGPLTDLYVGIANEHVDSVVALSKNIASIEYTSNSYGSSGDYVYIKFNKKYYTGDVATIDFSLHQSYMYILKDNKCTYSFTPGYFNDVRVKNVNILWNTKSVVDADTKKKDDGFYVWKDSLSKGEKITAKVEYNKSAFTSLDTTQQASYTYAYSQSQKSDSSVQAVVIFIIVIFIIAALMPSRRSYYSHRGYGYRVPPPPPSYHHRPGPRPRPRPYHHTPRPAPRHSRPSGGSFGGGSSRSSCVRSCACACACAGGGRAGCSRKDLYGIKTKDLKRVLHK